MIFGVICRGRNLGRKSYDLLFSWLLNIVKYFWVIICISEEMESDILEPISVSSAKIDVTRDTNLIVCTHLNVIEPILHCSRAG